MSLRARLVCVIFRQVRGDKTRLKGILWSSRLGVEHRDDYPHLINITVMKPQNRWSGPTQVCKANGRRRRRRRKKLCFDPVWLNVIYRALD
jgi:hypothetical protein